MAYSRVPAARTTRRLVWFTESGNNRVGNITTSGTVTEFSTLPTAFSGPAGITTGPDNAMWFLERNNNVVGRITTSGTGLVEYPIPTANAGLSGIVAGPDGDLWFTECAVGQIGRLQ
jgi:virginiamycin B lyase